MYKDGEEAPLTFVKERNGKYKYAPNTEEASATLVTDENGMIDVEGLDVGSYHFEETKAPEGYSAIHRWYRYNNLHNRRLRYHDRSSWSVLRNKKKNSEIINHKEPRTLLGGTEEPMKTGRLARPVFDKKAIHDSIQI